MKKFKLLSILFLIPLLLSGCGSSSNSSVAMSKATAMEMDSNYMDGVSYDSGDYMVEDYMTAELVSENKEFKSSTTNASKSDIPDTSDNRKLIKTVNLEIQTKQFDNFILKMEEILPTFDGYVESCNLEGNSYYNSRPDRYASYTVRIPKENLNNFLTDINDLGIISSKSESVEDVTLNYYDTEAQKEALEVEQDRLMDILESAETVDQIIALEQRLSEVRYELNSLGSTLRLLDNKVEYATVYLDINEVKVEIELDEEKSVFSEIKENWEINLFEITEFFEGLFINMVSNIAFIICEIILLVVIIVCIFGHNRRKKKKKLLEQIKTKE